MKSHRLITDRAVILLASTTLALFLAAPILALFLQTSPRDFVLGLQEPSVWPALRLSMITTLLALLIVVSLGTPLAWVIAAPTTPSPSQAGRLVTQPRRSITALLELGLQVPMVIPPAVAGVALLLAFGRRGIWGQWLAAHSVTLSFTTAAVVMAQVFVSAPYYVQSATSAFRLLDPKLLWVARSFGASPLTVFLQVAVPISARALIAGAAMSWARALGEFGATLMFAGNLQNQTQTLPLAIYAALESDVRAAKSLSILLVLVALLLLISLRVMLRTKHEPLQIETPT